MSSLTLLAGRLDSPWLLPATAVLVVCGCVAVWTLVVVRMWQGRAVVPYQPRRPVPWRGIEVLIVFMVFIVAPGGAMLLSMRWFDLGETGTPGADRVAELHTEHPAARVLMESGNLWTLVLCAATLIVVAAVVEEFLFRLVLQGWLEVLENRSLRRMPFFRRMLRGTVAVTVSSLLFAMVHYRPPQPEISLRVIAFRLAVQASAGLLTLGFVVALLRFRAGATLEDLGVVPARVAADVKLGLLAFFAVTPPVLLVNVVFKALLAKDIVADPIPIFFLALALGILYYRTHRILPAIVLHMAFNATGVAIALTMAGK